MFFLLAKLFALVAVPSHFGLLLLAGGTALLFGRRHRGGRWMVLLAALILVPGGLGAGQWLIRPLENRFPASPQLCAVDGIILLGGGEAPKLSAGRDQPILGSRSGKYFAALDLMRRFPQARLVVAAGSGSLAPGGTHETDVARGLFTEAGADLTRITFEDKSRDTWENFHNAKALMTPKPHERWVLITGATHMPRSVAIAREVGWPVIPWPTDYLSLPSRFLLSQDFPNNARELDAAAHEWIGLLVYRLTGRSNAIMPEVEPLDTGCTPPPVASES